MLLLDVGNSRCKWAYVTGGQWTQQGVVELAQLATLQADFARLPSPSRILISNVAGLDVATQLRSLCAHWSCTPEFVVAQSTQCGVVNGYAQSQQLGSDRWLALIAAWHHVHTACLVVNCGTATTLDAMSAKGEFMGGLILPGVQLMRSSLLGNTAQLVQQEGQLCDFPRNTADAIHSGVLRATLAAIEHQYAALAKRHAGAHCMVSGGAARQVLPHLSMPVAYLENLVLRGSHILGESKA